MDAAASHPDDALHLLVEAGELRRAGEWLVRAHAHEVVSLCRVMTRSRQDADDLAQDVFTRAVQALPSFRGEASSRTWLLSIARNRCIDQLRANKRDPWRGVRDEPDAVADEAAMPHDLISRRGEVERALTELAEGERALVVLRFRHGMEYEELSAVFGLREGAVRMRISRALARMRAHLEAPEHLMADGMSLGGQGVAAPVPASALPPSAPLPPPLAAAPSPGRAQQPPPAAPVPAPARRSRSADDDTRPTLPPDAPFAQSPRSAPAAPGRGLGAPAGGAGAVPDPLHLFFVATDEPFDMDRFLRAVA